MCIKLQDKAENTSVSSFCLCAQMNLQGLSRYRALTILVWGAFRADDHDIENIKDNSFLTIFYCVLTHSL